jgi:hypothetical protein
LGLSSPRKYSWIVLEPENESKTIFRSAGNYSSKDLAPYPKRIFCNAVVRNSIFAVSEETD